LAFAFVCCLDVVALEEAPGEIGRVWPHLIAEASVSQRTDLGLDPGDTVLGDQLPMQGYRHQWGAANAHPISPYCALRAWQLVSTTSKRQSLRPRSRATIRSDIARTAEHVTRAARRNSLVRQQRATVHCHAAPACFDCWPIARTSADSTGLSSQRVGTV